MGSLRQVSIEELDILGAPSDVLRSIHELFVEAEAMEIPDDPPKPLQWRLAQWATPMPAHIQRNWWLARDDGAIVGVTYSMTWQDDPQIAFVWTIVAESHRRRGIGSSLALAAMDVLLEEGHTSLIVDSKDAAPWEAAYARAGLEKALGERISRLRMADIDWELMRQWMSPNGAGDYDLLFIEFPIADEYIDRWCEIRLSMNTAPREGLELEDFTLTPEKWRENERAILGRDQTLLGYVAVHRPSGKFAAMTDVILRHHQPDHADQDDTVTHPEHRRHGLGRMIKAAMVTYLAENHPEVDHIDTGNAGSNAAMLKINVEMGFRPILLINAWQGDMREARDALSGQRE